MILESVLGRLRSRKAVEKLDEWQEYKAKVLLPLVQNKEVDIDAVDAFLQRLGKSEQDLREDVEQLQRRIELHAQMQSAKQCYDRLITLEPEIEKIDQEFAKVRAEFTAKLEPLVKLRKDLSLKSPPSIFADQLRQSVMDPSIKQGLDNNYAKRKEIRPRLEWLRTELFRDVNEGNRATVSYRISAIERELAESAAKKSFIESFTDTLQSNLIGKPLQLDYQDERISKLKEELKHYQEIRDQYAEELADLEKSQSELEAEEKILRQREMEP